MNNPILVRLATPEDAETLVKLNYEFNGVLMDIRTIQETLVSSKIMNTKRLPIRTMKGEPT